MVEVEKAPDRLAVLQRINDYEAQGKFNDDVENDPEAKPLLPDDIDYLSRSLTRRMKTKMAFSMATRFVYKQIDAGNLIIDKIVGLENFSSLSSGAVITCNHFNPFDSFALQIAYLRAKQPRRKFYRVIKEGNYTSFGGFYGFLMRNCDTLPLSSNMQTMRKFYESVNTLLSDGHFVLFYPEQSMWWNYKKPRPLKNGAFRFAAKNNVPVLPCFITMHDDDKIDTNGFPIQRYTIHIGSAIYPDNESNISVNSEKMKEQNFMQWKQIYEESYGIPLNYDTEVGII